MAPGRSGRKHELPADGAAMAQLRGVRWEPSAGVWAQGPGVETTKIESEGRGTIATARLVVSRLRMHFIETISAYDINRCAP